MKVIVGELPDKSKDCLFAEYINMTSTVIDSARLVSMSILPEHNVADENLKVRRVETNAEN